MIYVVDVAVALERPPREDRWRRYVVEAASALDAELLACQWAGLTSVMPVRSLVVF